MRVHVKEMRLSSIEGNEIWDIPDFLVSNSGLRHIL